MTKAINYSLDGEIKFHRILEVADKSTLFSEKHLAIVLVIRGVMNIKSYRGSYCIRQGGAFLTRYFSRKTIIDVHGTPLDGIICYVQPGVVRDILRQFPEKPSTGGFSLTREEISISPSAGLAHFTKSLDHYLPVDETDHDLGIMSHLKVTELLWLIMGGLPNGNVEGFLKAIHNPEEKPFDVLLENHYHESLSLPQLAKHAGCSVSTFKRQFQKYYHTTPGRWIINKRLERAYELLQNTTKNVSEICFEVGFESPSHFSSTFRKKFNRTPNQFRNEGSPA